MGERQRVSCDFELADLRTGPGHVPSSSGQSVFYLAYACAYFAWRSLTEISLGIVGILV